MMAFLANVTYTITFVLGVKFVFDELGEVGGYTAEIFIAYMIMMQLWWSIHTVLVRKNMQFLAKAINKGQLDFYLLKPVSLRKSLPVISVRFVDIIIIIFDLCAMVLLVDFSQFDYADMLLSVFFLGVGVAITYFFVSVIVNMTFWIGRNDFFTLLIGELAEIVQVPAVFFPPVLKILFTFFVPALLFAGPAVEALWRL